MPMRILCLHQGAELYGSDRSFLSAIEALGSSEAQRVDVVLPYDGPLASKIKELGLHPRFYFRGILRKSAASNPLRFLVDLVRSVFHHARSYRAYDVIYINTVVMLGPLIAATFYRYSKKVVTCHVREIPPRALISALRVLFVLGRVRLIYNSISTKDAFSLPGEVVYNGVEDAPLAPRATGPKKKTNILLIGRINAWKGQDLLLNSLFLLSEPVRSDFSVRVVGSAFAGNDHLEAALRVKATNLGLDGIVEFSSFAADPSTHYQWADYVVVPSTRPEPFGRVAIEAFAYGAPVIAANHGGLREIVTDKSNGFLFEPCNSEALASLISRLPSVGGEEYVTLSRAARREFSARFSLSRYEARIRSVLKVGNA